jgi:hypothetical protein
LLLAAADTVSILTVLISVLSSATVGGIIVAVLTGRHERDQQLREKMLTAAADFATSMTKLGAELDSLDRAAQEGSLDPQALQASLARYEVLREEASRQLVLIQMLYHPASATYAEAGMLWGRTLPPDEARKFVGDPDARRKAIWGGVLSTEDIRYRANWSYYFGKHVWEAIDDPRRLRGRRGRVPGLAATLGRNPRAATPGSQGSSERLSAAETDSAD